MNKDYEVLSIDELTRFSKTEGIERYYRHRIETKGGVIATVDIDEKDATPEKAAPILLKKAQELDGILKL